jgi:superfamily II DNA or RNA helicase
MIPVRVWGLKAVLPAGSIEHLLTPTVTRKSRDWKTKKIVDVERPEPVYWKSPLKGYIETGLGAVLYLAARYPFIQFTFVETRPPRHSITEKAIIPERMRMAPKWKVEGRERFYFFEALEACLRKTYGYVKLPTGSGKSEIMLCLALTQATYVGPGVILVPTLTVKGQFLERAAQYDIPLIDLRLATQKHADGEKQNYLCISTPISLLNDIDGDPSLVHDMAWLIADEAHHAASESWMQVFTSLPNCTRSHGFSALPIVPISQVANSLSSMDARDARAIAVSGPIIYEKTVHELANYLNSVKLISYKYSWTQDRGSVEWSDICDDLLANDARIQEIAELIRLLESLERKSILYVFRKDYGQKIQAAVRSPRTACWYGGGKVILDANPRRQRGFTPSAEWIRQQFGKDVLTLIATGHAIEGLDLQDPVDCLILLEGRSSQQTVQKAGRVLRPGHKKSIVINWEDSLPTLKRQHRIRARLIEEAYGCKSDRATNFVELKRKILQVTH